MTDKQNSDRDSEDNNVEVGVAKDKTNVSPLIDDEAFDKEYAKGFKTSYNKSSQASVDDLQRKVSELEKSLSEAQESAKDSNDKFMRACADLDNIRRRSKIDVENAHKFASERFAKELLLILDSLESGIQITENPQADVPSLAEGMKLTHKMFLDVFSKFDIEPINPQGEAFNPENCEVLTMQPSVDIAPNHVLQVVQVGYKQANRILRPARVIVSKAQEDTKE